MRNRHLHLIELKAAHAKKLFKAWHKGSDFGGDAVLKVHVDLR